MKDKIFTLLEDDIKDVISRFGIDAGLYPTEYGFVRDTFKLTPRVFKDIRLTGSVNVKEPKNENVGNIEVFVSIDYRYNVYGGGSNGSEMCGIHYIVDRGFDRFMDDKDNLRLLFKRKNVILPC